MKISIEANHAREILYTLAPIVDASRLEKNGNRILFVVKDGELSAYAQNGFMLLKVSVPTLGGDDDGRMLVLPYKKVHKNAERVEFDDSGDTLVVTMRNQEGLFDDGIVSLTEYPKAVNDEYVDVESAIIAGSASDNPRTIHVSLKLLLTALKAMDMKKSHQRLDVTIYEDAVTPIELALSAEDVSKSGVVLPLRLKSGDQS